ncbi:hypothetical protein C3L33_09136, partial [Rhododendron williamsianum]
MVTKFNSLSVSLREQVAIQDCKELLDFSVSELALSLAEMNKIRAVSPNDPHSQGNLKAWLSAACGWNRICSSGHNDPEHSRSSETPSSSTPKRSRFIDILQLQLRRLPGHP